MLVVQKIINDKIMRPKFTGVLGEGEDDTDSFFLVFESLKLADKAIPNVYGTWVYRSLTVFV